ncbi:hypothetical protein FHW89_004822 [Mucilaginibacter sp. SG564]|nr:hypothetical protein [Mucilaginibacter sp. SG564]
MTFVSLLNININTFIYEKNLDSRLLHRLISSNILY